MRNLRQIATVMVLNLKHLPSRAWPSLVIVIGMACVAGVLLSMLSLSTGFARTYMNAAAPDRAIVLSGDAQNEFGSTIPRDTLVTILNAPGIKKDVDGKPIASAEVLTGVPTTRKRDGGDSTILLRGVQPKFQVLRPEFKLVSGRMFRPGLKEMIIGLAGAAQFSGMDVGDKVILPDGEWTVVGAFKMGGTIVEGELLADTDTVLAGLRRTTYGSVIVRLESIGAFDAFKNALTMNPAIMVSVERHADYYARTVQVFVTAVSALSYAIGAILAAGAVFGALNTMYSAVSARTREIGTLRALGFGAFPVAVSVLSESLILALAGALIGAAGAWLLFNGQRHAVGANVFDLVVTPGLLVVGLGWAVGVAFLGGLFPAIRAARVPVTVALRAM